MKGTNAVTEYVNQANGDCLRTSFNLDSLGLPSFAVSSDGKIIAWNKKLAALSHMTEQIALHQLLPDILHSDEDRRQWKSALGKCFEENNPQKCAVHMKVCTGTSPFLVCIASHCSEDTIVDCAVCFVEAYNETSIAHRRDANGSVDLVDLDYCGIVERSSSATMGVDRNFSAFFWNTKMANVSGFSKSEAIGKPVLDSFITPGLRQSFVEIFSKAFEGETISDYHFELRTKVGEVRFLRSTITPYTDGNAIRGAIVVAEDVTNEAKNTPFTYADDELRRFIDTANILIFGVGQNGLLNEWNNETADAIGFKSEYALNKPLVGTFVSEGQRESMQSIQNDALLGKGMSNYELEMIMHSGETRHLLVTATPRRNINNIVNGVLYIAHDITEASKHDRAVAAMANELRQLIDNANAPIFGINCDG